MAPWRRALDVSHALVGRVTMLMVTCRGQGAATFPHQWALVTLGYLRKHDPSPSRLAAGFASAVRRRALPMARCLRCRDLYVINTP